MPRALPGPVLLFFFEMPRACRAWSSLKYGKIRAGPGPGRGPALLLPLVPRGYVHYVFLVQFTWVALGARAFDCGRDDDDTLSGVNQGAQSPAVS